MKKDAVKLFVAVALKPLTDADTLLIEVENIMIEHNKVNVDGKSEIRQTLERFENNLKVVWEEKFKEYRVDHVFKLPLDVYKAVCKKFIQEAGSKIINDFVHEAAQEPWIYKLPKENPYVLAIGALVRSYNIKG